MPKLSLLGSPASNLFVFYTLLFAVAYYFPAASNLEYEFSVASVIVALVFIPLAGLFSEKPRSLLLGASLGYVAYLAIGELLFALGQCPCSLEGYRWWLSFNLFPAWILAHALALVYYRLKERMSHLRLLALHAGVLVIAIFIDGMTLWHFPQKRLTSFFFSHLHGPVYDDFIPLAFEIFWLRMFHLAIALLLIAMAIFIKTKRHFYLSLGFFLFLGVGEICFRLSQPFLAFGKGALSKELSGLQKGEGYELHFPSEFTRSRKMAVFERELKFHLSELRALFGTDVPTVQIYVYTNEEQKKLLFGGGNTDVTDVVTPSIHLTLTPSPHPSLRHELVHALSSRFAFFGLGFHPNMAFTEGLAVSLEYRDRPYSLHEAASYILSEQKAFHVSELLSPLFWLRSAPEAYTVAGSLLSYLRETYGLKKVLVVYGGVSISRAIGIDEATLERQYLVFLEGKSNNQASLYFKSRFKNEGVFARPCPHTSIDYEQENGYLLSLRRPSGWQPERDFNTWYRKLDPKNTHAIYMDIKTKARNEQDRAKILALIEPHLERWESDLNLAKLLLLKSDLLINTSPKESQELLKKLLSLSQKKILPEPFHRGLYLRTLLSGRIFESWRRYLAGLGEKPPFDLAKKPGFAISYLELVNNLTNISEEQLVYFHSLNLDPRIERALQKNWHKSLAIAALYLGQNAIGLAHIHTISLIGISEGEEEYLVFLAKLLRLAS